MRKTRLFLYFYILLIPATYNYCLRLCNQVIKYIYFLLPGHLRLTIFCIRVRNNFPVSCTQETKCQYVSRPKHTDIGITANQSAIIHFCGDLFQHHNLPSHNCGYYYIVQILERWYDFRLETVNYTIFLMFDCEQCLFSVYPRGDPAH